MKMNLKKINITNLNMVKDHNISNTTVLIREYSVNNLKPKTDFKSGLLFTVYCLLFTVYCLLFTRGSPSCPSMGNRNYRFWG